MVDYMLTTIDNPYDPFTQYDDWYEFDDDSGYCTPSYLARVVGETDTLSDSQYDEAVLEAMNTIIHEDPIGIYFKMKKGDKVVGKSLVKEAESLQNSQKSDNEAQNSTKTDKKLEKQ